MQGNSACCNGCRYKHTAHDCVSSMGYCMSVAVQGRLVTRGCMAYKVMSHASLTTGLLCVQGGTA